MWTAIKMTFAAAAIWVGFGIASDVGNLLIKANAYATASKK